MKGRGRQPGCLSGQEICHWHQSYIRALSFQFFCSGKLKTGRREHEISFDVNGKFLILKDSQAVFFCPSATTWTNLSPGTFQYVIDPDQVSLFILQQQPFFLTTPLRQVMCTQAKVPFLQTGYMHTSNSQTTLSFSRGCYIPWILGSIPLLTICL